VAERETAKKTKIGVVKSNKMQKTVVVSVEKSVKHPLYKKILKRTKNLKAHDENNKCQVGDQVLIAETRPLSKDKCWRVVEILKSAS
jgi:small subunit ribosomal protein S17